MNDQVKNKRGISLSTQILIGLAFGLFFGLFFGEKASVLAIVGKSLRWADSDVDPTIHGGIIDAWYRLFEL